MRQADEAFRAAAAAESIENFDRSSLTKQTTKVVTKMSMMGLDYPVEFCKDQLSRARATLAATTPDGTAAAEAEVARCEGALAKAEAAAKQARAKKAFSQNILEAQRKAEPSETILARDCRAIFAYGTLRADFSAEGDNWGFMSSVQREHGCECAWHLAAVSGYALYQNPDLDYPFATSAPAATDGRVVGTVLTWPDEACFADALQRCNGIERYDPSGRGLYRRAVVTARSLEDGSETQAYMYWQDKTPEEVAESRAFPDGDWLAER